MAETNIKDVKLKIGTETQFQSKLKDLPINTLVGTTDPIQEGELDTSIITKLGKAENALPKPTNDTTGSAGQVLKKTANGSEWGDAPSGGGKLYIHQIGIFSTTTTFTLSIRILSNKAEKFNTNDMFDNINKIIYQRITDMREGPAKFYENHTIEHTTNINDITVNYFTTYPYDVTSRPSFEFTEGSYRFNDSVIEL